MIRRVVDPDNPDAALIEEAAAFLRRGELVAFPTETVYGLGANGLDGAAARRIFAAKGRPADNPLILHVADVTGAEAIAHLDDRARRLFACFSPGPLTLVLPARRIVPEEARAGLPTVAVRIPAHPVALALIRVAELPIAAPSANSSGRPSPTHADAVEEDLAVHLAMLLDGGPTGVGLESTVLDASCPELCLLRPGGLSLESIEAEAGPVLSPTGHYERRRSPGTRHRHYAPHVPLVVWSPGVTGSPGSAQVDDRWAYIGVTPFPFPCAHQVLFESVEKYAAGFFAALRKMERLGVSGIVAEMPPETGIGRALADRIRRAAGECEDL